MSKDRYALVAEPDARLCYVLTHVLALQGLDPISTRDGAVAQATLQKRGLPAILIVNPSLPRVDGFALIEELRRLDPGRRTPVVVISPSLDARAAAYDRRRELGITEILGAGMSSSSLQSALLRALAGEGTSASASLTPTANEPVQVEPPPSSMAAPISRVPSSVDPARLARITQMGIVDDAPPEASLQRLVEETAAAFDVPISVVSIVLPNRQWFKAQVGLSGKILADRGTPIEDAFCRHIVDAETVGPLVVPDATKHPVFAKNRLVVEGAVGSYAGAPLLTPRGDVLGTLCIIDSKPLGIGPEQVDHLVALAGRVAGEIELASQAHKGTTRLSGTRARAEPGATRAVGTVAALDAYEAVIANLEDGILLAAASGELLLANPALAELLGIPEALIISYSMAELIHVLTERSAARDAGHLESFELPRGPHVASEYVELVRPTPRLLRWSTKPIELTGGVAQFATFSDARARSAWGPLRDTIGMAPTLRPPPND